MQINIEWLQEAMPLFFPLPWQDLLTQLHDGESMEELGKGISLPRTGQELTHAVSMWLILVETEDSEKKALASSIHQAMARCAVVVKPIASMKRRGHRAYKHIDIVKVEAKVADLPENSVPPEIIKLLPLDGLFGKLQLQKSATPCGNTHVCRRSSRRFR